MNSARSRLLRRSPWALLLLALAAALAGCGGATAVRSVGGAESGRCLLLTTNDSEAHFDGERVELDPLRYSGTIARIAATKKRLADEREGAVLLLSAGDVLQGRYMEREDHDRKRAAREAWQLYEAAGYDLGTLGNHEFDAGPAVLAHALRGLTRYRMVVSNLAKDSTTLDNRDGKLWDEVSVRTCGGAKIGFFGLLTPSTRTISQFGDTRFADPEDPVVPAARRAIARLKAAGATVIVGLTHLGFRDDLALAEELQGSGVDLLIGGHSHTLVKRWKAVGETLVVQSGQRFSHLGHLELVTGAGGRFDPSRSSWKVVPVDEDMASDDATEKALDQLRQGYVREQVIGKRSVPWGLRGWQRHIYGARVARAVWRFAAAQNRAGVPFDGAILNSGGLRTSKTYPPGPVTNFEVRAIHPFGNRVVMVELDGEQLRDVLEHACTGGHRNALGERVELWGLRFQCDGARPGVRYKMVDGKPVAISRRGERVMNATVGGQPLVLQQTYRVAINDYLARGGSGYWAFSRGTRSCLDGSAFEPGHCRGSATLAEVVEAAVKDGSFDAPLPQR